MVSSLIEGYEGENAASGSASETTLSPEETESIANRRLWQEQHPDFKRALLKWINIFFQYNENDENFRYLKEFIANPANWKNEAAVMNFIITCIDDTLPRTLDDIPDNLKQILNNVFALFKPTFCRRTEAHTQTETKVCEESTMPFKILHEALAVELNEAALERQAFFQSLSQYNTTEIVFLLERMQALQSAFVSDGGSWNASVEQRARILVQEWTGEPVAELVAKLDTTPIETSKAYRNWLASLPDLDQNHAELAHRFNE